MLFYTLQIKDKEYKARLTARAVVELEKKLGTNPVNVFVNMAQDNKYVPELEQLIVMLHASLQAMEHGITLEKTYELYDEMIDDGKNIGDLLAVIIDIFKVSGMIPEEKKESKNAK